MNKRQFIKTGIIGSIIGLFAPKLLATQNVGKIPINVFNTNMVLTSSLIVTDIRNIVVDLIKNKELQPAFYQLEGNLEEILMKQHRQTLAILARHMVESNANKHLNLDMIETLSILKNKYKITNVEQL